jgi:hypothetical protein
LESAQLRVSFLLTAHKKECAIFIHARNGIRTHDYDVGGIRDHTRLIPRLCSDRRNLYSFLKDVTEVRLETSF